MAFNARILPPPHLPPSAALCYHSGKEPVAQPQVRRPGRSDMEGHDNGVARRTVLMSAGVGIGAGLVSGLPAQAEGTAAAGQAEIWSQEYWANKGSVKLSLWRKRVGAPKAGEKPLPVLFMVH